MGLRSQLENLIQTYAAEIKKAESAPSRTKERKNLKEALSNIREARTTIRACGVVGQLVLRAVAPKVGLTVSTGWLRRSFPHEPSVPLPLSDTLHSSIHPPIHENDDSSDLSDRVEFVRSHPVETIDVILRDVELGLESALSAMSRLPRGSGGRTPLTYRHWFLINLIVIWESLGEQVLAGPKSKLVDFCEAVAASISWPTEGLLDAVQNAANDWRNLKEKSMQ
jgi:hypothetical protein